jgi:hypothetical protein
MSRDVGWAEVVVGHGLDSLVNENVHANAMGLVGVFSAQRFYQNLLDVMKRHICGVAAIRR